MKNTVSEMARIAAVVCVHGAQNTEDAIATDRTSGIASLTRHHVGE